MVRTLPVDVETNGEISFTYMIALCPNEKWCAHACPDGAIQVRNAETGALFRTLRGLGGVLGALVFSPDGSRLLGADEYGTLKIWDVATGREIAATKLTGVLIMCARFSADGKRLAVAGLFGQLVTGEVRILDAETAREVWSLKGHTLLVSDVAFSPDGLRLATASNDQTVRLWDLTTGQEILKLVDSGTFKRRSVSFRRPPPDPRHRRPKDPRLGRHTAAGVAGGWTRCRRIPDPFSAGAGNGNGGGERKRGRGTETGAQLVS